MSAPEVDSLARIEADVVRCTRCPRLVAYREAVARTKRRSFADWNYWGRPVPGYGDVHARIWIVGLAPAAHGGNRTGRIFTGDRSGDFLFAALHRVGLANQPQSVARDDGLALRDVYISAAARCAPPGNRPERDELERCSEYLDRDARALTARRVIVCLGGIAWDAVLRLLERRGSVLPKPRPRFAHGAELSIDGELVLGSFHVSQQNTFTGRLTPSMFDALLERAKTTAGRAF